MNHAQLLPQDDSDISSSLDKLARRIVELRLESPALFFLEAHLPATAILHTGTLFLAPLVSPLFGFERVALLQEVLADRKHIQSLILMIEAYSSSREPAAAAQRN